MQHLTYSVCTVQQIDVRLSSAVLYMYTYIVSTTVENKIHHIFEFHVVFKQVILLQHENSVRKNLGT